MKKVQIRGLVSFKRVARDLGRNLDLRHSHALERLAKACGYAHYQAVLAALHEDGAPTHPDPCNVDEWVDRLSAECGTGMNAPEVREWFDHLTRKGMGRHEGATVEDRSPESRGLLPLQI